MRPPLRWLTVWAAAFVVWGLIDPALATTHPVAFVWIVRTLRFALYGSFAMVVVTFVKSRRVRSS